MAIALLAAAPISSPSFAEDAGTPAPEDAPPLPKAEDAPPTAPLPDAPKTSSKAPATPSTEETPAPPPGANGDATPGSTPAEQATVPAEAQPLGTAEENPTTPPSPAQDTAAGSGSTEESKIEARVSGNTSHEFDNERPWLGFEMMGSPQTFGSDDPFNGGAGSRASGISAYVELMPKGIQDIGVISFGPSVAVYPVGANDNGEYRTPSFASVWSIGAQVRYQFRYFRNQLIVPMVGLAVEDLHYKLSEANGQSALEGSISTVGPVGGLWLLLNPLESSAASDLYVSSGILRSYLAVEVRALQGSDENIDVGGASFFFGLHLEM